MNQDAEFMTTPEIESSVEAQTASEETDSEKSTLADKVSKYAHYDRLEG